MQEDPDQAEKEDDKASIGGIINLGFILLNDFENNADALETTEPANEGTSTLEPPSAFAEMKPNLPESSSPGNSKDNEQRLIMDSPRRRRIEGAARVPFLGTLPEEEWEVHQQDHENRTGCRLERVAFMEEVWTVVQSYGTQSMLKGLGAGWTASFLAKFYTKLSRYLIKEFLQTVVEVSIVELLALLVTFGAENFVKGPVVLLTEGVQNWRLYGLP